MYQAGKLTQSKRCKKWLYRIKRKHATSPFSLYFLLSQCLIHLSFSVLRLEQLEHTMCDSVKWEKSLRVCLCSHFLGHQYILYILLSLIGVLEKTKERMKKKTCSVNSRLCNSGAVIRWPINIDCQQQHIVGQCFPSAHSALFIPNCLACYASALLWHWQRNQETHCAAPTPSQTFTDASLAVCVTPSNKKTNNQFAIHRSFHWQVQLRCSPVD